MAMEMIPFTARITSTSYKLPYMKTTFIDNMMVAWENLVKKNTTDFNNLSKWLKYLNRQSVNPRRYEIRKQYMWYLRITLEAKFQCLPFTEPIPQRLPELYIYLENNNKAKTQYIELIKYLNEDKDALKQNKSFSALNKEYQMDVESGTFQSFSDPSFVNDLVINERLEIEQRKNNPLEESERSNVEQNELLKRYKEQEQNKIVANALNLRKDLLKEKDVLLTTNNSDRNIQKRPSDTKVIISFTGQNNSPTINSNVKKTNKANIERFKRTKQKNIPFLMSKEENQKRNINNEELKKNMAVVDKQNSWSSADNKDSLAKTRETMKAALSKQKELQSNMYTTNEPVNLNDLLNKYDKRSKLPSTNKMPMKLQKSKNKVTD